MARVGDDGSPYQRAAGPSHDRVHPEHVTIPDLERGIDEAPATDRGWCPGAGRNRDWRRPSADWWQEGLGQNAP